MQQEFFATMQPEPTGLRGPINVASVPQRSPFRYPGGKTWFVPTFRRWMSQASVKPNLLVEPFAGGATIALTAVCENWVDHAVLMELDPDVAAVWRALMAICFLSEIIRPAIAARFSFSAGMAKVFMHRI